MVACGYIEVRACRQAKGEQFCVVSDIIDAFNVSRVIFHTCKWNEGYIVTMMHNVCKNYK